MKLMTKDIERKLLKTTLNSDESMNQNAKVIVKYFNPLGKATWLITAGEKQPDGDWLLSGYCRISKWEWGCVSLRELMSVKLPLGMTIERDMCATGTVANLSAA